MDKNRGMSSMDFYEQVVDKHSLCPGDYLYNSNALAGEVGECANNVKKIRMATIRPDWVTRNENKLPEMAEFQSKLDDELGDALFYLTRLAHDNNTSLGEIMWRQIEKLSAQSVKYNVTFLK